jgi:3-oxoacyl-[acyl-carrier protein] reductase
MLCRKQLRIALQTILFVTCRRNKRYIMSTSKSAPSPFRPDLLAGKTALVTGSSSGIGRAIAVALGHAGASVHLHARANADGFAEVRKTIDAVGRDYLVDLRDSSACREFAEKAWNAGPIDVWVNNAGVDVLTGDVAEWDFEEKLAALLEVDVKATINLSRAIGRKMQQRGSGVILNIGWDQAETGMEGDSGEMFAAAKGAVAAFTRSLAKSLAPQVRVNGIAPGWIRTKWAKGASEQWDRRARSEALLARWGEAEDIANAAVFLASPAAAFVTGQVIPVNGGFAGGHQE